MYSFLKIWVKAALQFYCGSISVSHEVNIPNNRPVLLACNHPNSFLDALIIASVVPMQVCFLAKGSAFRNPFISSVLRMLNMVPVYGLQDNKENLLNNASSFNECQGVFKNNGAVLIFSEGISVNVHELRLLKKSTARLAYAAWTDNIEDLIVIPVTINYHSFSKLPKHVTVHFQEPITQHDFEFKNQAVFYTDFNDALERKLNKGIAIPVKGTGISKLKKVLLMLPAFAGFASQYWYYYLLKLIVLNKTKGTEFYDSVLFALLTISYPFLIAVLTLSVVLYTGNINWFVLLLILPLTAWCFKAYKGTT